jgi:hypothetical protein
VLKETTKLPFSEYYLESRSIPVNELNFMVKWTKVGITYRGAAVRVALRVFHSRLSHNDTLHSLCMRFLRTKYRSAESVEAWTH